MTAHVANRHQLYRTCRSWAVNGPFGLAPWRTGIAILVQNPRTKKLVALGYRLLCRRECQFCLYRRGKRPASNTLPEQSNSSKQPPSTALLQYAADTREPHGCGRADDGYIAVFRKKDRKSSLISLRGRATMEPGEGGLRLNRSGSRQLAKTIIQSKRRIGLMRPGWMTVLQE